MITQAELKALLDYDLLTGCFHWVARRSGVTVGSRAGCVENTGYRRIRLNGRLYQEHALAWLYVHGTYPAEDIDHINHIATDNRIENLRCVSKRENSLNKRLSNRSASRVCGVYFVKRTGKWQAQIRVNGALKSLGTFSDFNDAVAARASGNTLYGFHINHGK